MTWKEIGGTFLQFWAYSIFCSAHCLQECVQFVKIPPGVCTVLHICDTSITRKPFSPTSRYVSMISANWGGELGTRIH